MIFILLNGIGDFTISYLMSAYPLIAPQNPSVGASASGFMHPLPQPIFNYNEWSRCDFTDENTVLSFKDHLGVVYDSLPTKEDKVRWIARCIKQVNADNNPDAVLVQDFIKASIYGLSHSSSNNTKAKSSYINIILSDKDNSTAEGQESFKYLRARANYELASMIERGAFSGMIDREYHIVFYLKKCVELVPIPEACFALGVRYMQGLQREKFDPAHPELHWLSMAAQAGHVRAMYMLGKYYNDLCQQHKEGAFTQYKRQCYALYWWGQAAERKSLDAMLELANLYYDRTFNVRWDGEHFIKLSYKPRVESLIWYLKVYQLKLDGKRPDIVVQRLNFLTKHPQLLEDPYVRYLVNRINPINFLNNIIQHGCMVNYVHGLTQQELVSCIIEDQFLDSDQKIRLIYAIDTQGFSVKVVLEQGSYTLQKIFASLVYNFAEPLEVAEGPNAEVELETKYTIAKRLLPCVTMDSGFFVRATQQYVKLKGADQIGEATREELKRNLELSLQRMEPPKTLEDISDESTFGIEVLKNKSIETVQDWKRLMDLRQKNQLIDKQVNDYAAEHALINALVQELSFTDL